jgi:DNA polymerase-3 subunit epsilon
MGNMIALFFDTETTGFKTSTFTPEIVQIGALLQDMESGKVVGELNLICQAANPIPPVVSEIHGITDDLSARFGVKQAVADGMFATLASKADVVVAHNIEFDLGIIDGAWQTSRAILKSKPQFCTMRSCSPIKDMPRKHAGKTQYCKLADAYRYFYEQDFDNAHDAMADVRACRDVFLSLISHDWYTFMNGSGIVPTQKNLDALAGV